MADYAIEILWNWSSLIQFQSWSFKLRADSWCWCWCYVDVYILNFIGHNFHLVALLAGNLRYCPNKTFSSILPFSYYGVCICACVYFSNLFPLWFFYFFSENSVKSLIRDLVLTHQCFLVRQKWFAIIQTIKGIDFPSFLFRKLVLKFYLIIV